MGESNIPEVESISDRDLTLGFNLPEEESEQLSY